MCGKQRRARVEARRAIWKRLQYVDKRWWWLQGSLREADGLKVYFRGRISMCWGIGRGEGGKERIWCCREDGVAVDWAERRQIEEGRPKEEVCWGEHRVGICWSLRSIQVEMSYRNSFFKKKMFVFYIFLYSHS